MISFKSTQQDTLPKLLRTAKQNTVPHYQRKHQLSTATVGRKVPADKNTIYSKECTKLFKRKT